MGQIIYNGITSDDVGVIVENVPAYTVPKKEYSFTHVSGLNGDYVQCLNSFQNGKKSYNIAAVANDNSFVEVANKIMAWLYSADTYARLEDSYEPEYFMKAVFEGGISIDNILHAAGRTTIEFNCKPQRFLKIGEEPISAISGMTIMNPTSQIALPKITILGTGNGTININNGYHNETATTLKDIKSEIVIDSEAQDAYSGTENRNSDILCNEFIKIYPGLNTISFEGTGITGVTVIPNWWTI